ncbi:saccharopine dehydrogenase family protein [Pacificimonas sp. ICDLI1SI03]
MTGDLLFYGAYGYTGRLVTERAVARGLSPILAGRNADRVEALARQYGLRWRAFDLGNRAAPELADVSTVLNMAGPFSRTAVPMAEACLQSGTNYVDITGEITVFEALHALGDRAIDSGIVLLPGAGFDVVPSDCLAAHLHRRLPAAQSLHFVIGGLNKLSRGTAKTGLESIAYGTKVRRDGDVVTLPKTPRGTSDLGHGLRATIGVSWGDVATAFYSTGIPNIEVYFESTPDMARMASLPSVLRWLLKTALGQWVGRRAIDRMPPGPNLEQRDRARAILQAEADDANGTTVISRMETPEAYKLTSMTALDIAERLARGEVSPGYHTPSSAFGADYILGFSGVSRTDL